VFTPESREEEKTQNDPKERHEPFLRDTLDDTTTNTITEAEATGIQ
jgi:hypothetical protein